MLCVGVSGDVAHSCSLHHIRYSSKQLAQRRDCWTGQPLKANAAGKNLILWLTNVREQPNERKPMRRRRKLARNEKRIQEKIAHSYAKVLELTRLNYNESWFLTNVSFIPPYLTSNSEKTPSLEACCQKWLFVTPVPKPKWTSPTLNLYTLSLC